MAFTVKKAVREKIYTKIALMAPSGGGKTYGALRLATGMAEEIEKETGKKAKILMGNTEQKRGYYYANEFDYDIVDIEAPHNPEKYVEFLEFAVAEGYSIVIIDSSSHEWEGKGGCLELHQQAGGQYQNWKSITPRHNRFINAIADSPIHVIATMRGKDQYEMIKDERGKASVQKLGVGAKQRDGFEYEFTCTFLIDQKTNTAEVEKDNTHLFEGNGAILLTEDHGRKIIKWANEGSSYTPPKRIEEDKAAANADAVPELKKKITEVFKSKGGQTNAQLMAYFKEHGNYNGLSDVDALNKYLADVEAID